MDIHGIEYFNSQVCEFRNQMGLKTFWADPNKVRAAVKALFTLYNSITGTPKEQENVGITYESTMLEFTRRLWTLKTPKISGTPPLMNAPTSSKAFRFCKNHRGSQEFTSETKKAGYGPAALSIKLLPPTTNLS